MENNKEIDVRNKDNDDLLEIYNLIAEKSNLVQNRLRELFEENKENEELLEEEKNN